MRGFTLNKGAVHRWVLTQHERSLIVSECEKMACSTGCPRKKKDLDLSRVKRDEEDVKNVMSALENMINPFKQMDHVLVNIASGRVATPEVADDLLNSKEKGNDDLLLFCSERLSSNREDFYAPLKKRKLKTFGHMSKVSRLSVKGMELSLKSDRDLFARLVVIGKKREMEIAELLSFSLGAVPLSISNHYGTLMKTAKSKLIACLEDLPEAAPHVHVIPEGSTIIIDGMATLQQLNNIPSTFGELADIVISNLKRMAIFIKSNCVHFVTDRYPADSIKKC